MQLCKCGCGQPTAVIALTDKKQGRVKGQPNRFISGHNFRIGQRLEKHPNWTGGKRKKGQYISIKMPEHPRADPGGYVYEQILVAEKALGKLLPPLAEVHHVDENKWNNTPTNLVICQDGAFHQLLHRRMRALKACGNPNYEICLHCRQWNHPTTMKSNGRNGYYHQPCRAAYDHKRRSKKDKVAALAASIAALFFIGGCATKKPYAPPPSPPPPMVEAQAVEAPEVQRVEPPVEVSFLDTLEPDLSTAAKKFIATGKAEIIDRMKTSGFVVVPYNARQVPTVTCKAGNFCSVELEKGEYVKKEHGWYIADETRWTAFILEHGEGTDLVQTILLKPLDSLPYLKTNARIGTNRRAYNIDVVYGGKQTRKLSFWYPQDIVKQLNQSAEQRRAQEKTIAARGLQVDLKSLSTRYNIECNGARFCPSFVGSDNARTFILLPQGLEALGVPAVMIQRSGENQIPNVNPHSLPWITVEGLFDKAQLRYGMDNAQPVVEITRY